MAHRFDTKDLAENWIKEQHKDVSYCFTPTFVSSHYAPEIGLGKGGWYVMNNTAGREFI